MYFLYNKKKIDVGLLILLMYAISSSISIYYFSFSFVSSYFNKITIIPFIYLFLLTTLCIYPLLKYDSSNVKVITALNSSGFIYILSVLIIVVTLEPIIENILLFTKSRDESSSHIADIYNSSADGNIIEMYSFLGRRLSYVSILFSTSSVIFLFYYLTKQKKKIWVLIGLGMVSCNTVLYYFNTSNRAGVLSHFFFIICCYLLFKNCILKSTLKKINYIGFLFLVMIISLTTIVTLGRFNNGSKNSDLNAVAWVALYAGEGPLKFNNDLWYIKYHTNGDDIFPFFKNLIGLDTFTDTASRDNYYFRKNGIQIENFYTIVGDIFYDFGILGTPIFCFFIFVCITILVKRRKTYPLEIIFLLAIIVHIFLMGFAAYIHRAYTAQFGLLFPLFVMLGLYFNRKKLIN